jgi:hypothetical protein
MRCCALLLQPADASVHLYLHIYLDDLYDLNVYYISREAQGDTAALGASFFSQVNIISIERPRAIRPPRAPGKCSELTAVGVAGRRGRGRQGRRRQRRRRRRRRCSV